MKPHSEWWWKWEDVEYGPFFTKRHAMDDLCSKYGITHRVAEFCVYCKVVQY